MHRTTDYKFSYAKMLAMKGNTAPYMLYVVARINGIYRKGAEGGGDAAGGPKEFDFGEDAEITLARHLIKLSAMLKSVVERNEPNRICDYIFELGNCFNSFYERCPVNSVQGELRASRLAMLKITLEVMKSCMGLLGMETVNKL